MTHNTLGHTDTNLYTLRNTHMQTHSHRTLIERVSGAEGTVFQCVCMTTKDNWVSGSCVGQKGQRNGVNVNLINMINVKIYD